MNPPSLYPHIVVLTSWTIVFYLDDRCRELMQQLSKAAEKVQELEKKNQILKTTSGGGANPATATAAAATLGATAAAAATVSLSSTQLKELDSLKSEFENLKAELLSRDHALMDSQGHATNLQLQLDQALATASLSSSSAVATRQEAAADGHGGVSGQEAEELRSRLSEVETQLKVSQEKEIELENKLAQMVALPSPGVPPSSVSQDHVSLDL